MSREHYLMLFIFILNALIVLIYLILQFLRKKEKKQGYLIKAFVMFLCPVAGPVFFVGSYIVYWLFFKVKADLSDVVFSKEKRKEHVHADEEKDMNVVPLEEALAVSDTDNLRRLMLNVVRGDMSRSLASIALALNSEDSETSHYAASVLQDELNTFRVTVQKLYLQVKREEEEQCEYAELLLDYMNKVLRQQVFTDMEQRSYVKMMDEVGEILYEKEKERINGKMYEHICLRILETGDYDACLKWCLRGKETFPNLLSSFTCLLKLYFSSGQKEQFFDVMNELKESNVVVDNETLELIRIFS